MRGGPRSFPQGSSCPVVLWILPPSSSLRLRGSHPLRPVFPGPFCWDLKWIPQSEPRHAAHDGLGSSGSARRYSRNHFCFLFLRLLRCFSSPGSPPYPIYSGMDTRSLSVWVSPFRYPWIAGYMLLPTAFRSLSRLSSALSARASTLCSFLLNLLFLVLFLACCIALQLPALCLQVNCLGSLLMLTASAIYSFSFFFLHLPSLPADASDVFIVFWIFSIRFSRYVLHI